MEERIITAGKSGLTIYDGNGFRTDGQITEPAAREPVYQPASPELQRGKQTEPELVRSGDGFRVDRRLMEKRVKEELAKIADEQLLPFKVYLKEGLLNNSIPAALVINIMALFFLTSWPKNSSDFICAMYFIYWLVSLISCTIGIAFIVDKGMLLSAIYKLYQAKKVNKQVMETLHNEAMDSKVKLTSIRKEFPRRVAAILKHRASEEAKKIREHKKMLKQAENSKF